MLTEPKPNEKPASLHHLAAQAASFNTEMEPTRLLVDIVLSPRRAAHFEGWARESGSCRVSEEATKFFRGLYPSERRYLEAHLAEIERLYGHLSKLPQTDTARSCRKESTPEP